MGEAQKNQPLRVGDTVMRRPSFGFVSDDWRRPDSKRVLPAKVVYVHPTCRFHTVEFTCGGVTWRESFFRGEGQA